MKVKICSNLAYSVLPYQGWNGERTLPFVSIEQRYLEAKWKAYKLAKKSWWPYNKEKRVMSALSDSISTTYYKEKSPHLVSVSLPLSLYSNTKACQNSDKQMSI